VALNERGRQALRVRQIVFHAASAFVVASLVLCACRPEPAAPPSVLVGAVDPPLAAPPHRIVPATTAAAEYVAALVGAERIAALPEQVDGYATRDFRVPPLDAVPRFPRYLAESLLGFQPDLVVTFVWQNQDSTAVLRREKVPVLVLRSGTDYASVRETLEILGRTLSAEGQAAEIVRQLDARVATLRERASKRPVRRALVYTNDGTGGWAAGKGTTAGGLLELVGLVNAGAQDGIVEHQPIDMERLLRIDPDLFVCGSPSAAEGGSATKALLLSAVPLASLKAVREQRILVIPSILLSADSPAILDAADALEAELLRVFPDRQ
jgi:iron complex transport system substrate-binding protein